VTHTRCVSQNVIDNSVLINVFKVYYTQLWTGLDSKTALGLRNRRAILFLDASADVVPMTTITHETSELAATGTVGYPVIGRSGLGNALFPWARCVVWCHDHRVPMLRPQFRQIHIGPYLRRERDKRQYHRLFRNPGYVSGWRRLLKIQLARRVPEGSTDVQSATVWFEGMEGLFQPIFGRSELVRSALRRMTRPELLPDAPSSDYMAVHIRRGDFTPAPNETVLRSGAWNYQLPIEWFRHCILEARRSVQTNMAVVVFSDGTDDQIREVLQLPNVTRSSAKSAITDLLGISQAKILVASGSTFSMWGAYLGQVPTIWFPGQRRHRVLSSANELSEYELDFGQRLPDAFLDSSSDFAPA
jgi:hypothetical protein